MNWLRPWPRNVMFYPQISLRSTSLRAPWNLCWTSALVHDHGHDAYYLRPRCSTCFYDGYKPVYPRRNPVVIAIIRQISCKIWLISSAFYPTFALDTTAVKLFTQQAFHTALRVTQQHHIANRRTPQPHRECYQEVRWRRSGKLCARKHTNAYLLIQLAKWGPGKHDALSYASAPFR